jgi:hypothetical protein
MAMTLGSIFILAFWGAMTQPRFGQTTSGFGPIKGRPPQAIAYLNPFVAQADVVCGTQTTYGAWCARMAQLLNGNSGVVVFSTTPTPDAPVNIAPAVDTIRAPVAEGVAPARDVAAAAQPFGPARDAFWPRSVVSWLILSIFFVALSVQFVSPTRRWRLGLRRGSRRSV